MGEVIRLSPEMLKRESKWRGDRRRVWCDETEATFAELAKQAKANDQSIPDYVGELIEHWVKLNRELDDMDVVIDLA